MPSVCLRLSPRRWEDVSTHLWLGLPRAAVPRVLLEPFSVSLSVLPRARPLPPSGPAGGQTHGVVSAALVTHGEGWEPFSHPALQAGSGLRGQQTPPWPNVKDPRGLSPPVFSCFSLAGEGGPSRGGSSAAPAAPAALLALAGERDRPWAAPTPRSELLTALCLPGGTGKPRHHRAAVRAVLPASISPVPAPQVRLTLARCELEVVSLCIPTRQRCSALGWRGRGQSLTAEVSLGILGGGCLSPGSSGN